MSTDYHYASTLSVHLRRYAQLTDVQQEMLVNILLMPHTQTAMVVKQTLTIGLSLGF